MFTDRIGLHSVLLPLLITVKNNHEEFYLSSKVDKIVATLEAKNRYDKNIEIKLSSLIH